MKSFLSTEEPFSLFKKNVSGGNRSRVHALKKPIVFGQMLYKGIELLLVTAPQPRHLVLRVWVHASHNNHLRVHAIQGTRITFRKRV